MTHEYWLFLSSFLLQCHQQEVKRAALHELIEFVTTNGSSNAAAAAGVSSKVKDEDKDSKDSSETPSLISTAFETTFYQDMVNTVSHLTRDIFSMFLFSTNKTETSIF